MEETITKRELLKTFIERCNEYEKNSEFYYSLCDTGRGHDYGLKWLAIRSIIDEFFDEDYDYRFVRVQENAFGVSFEWQKAVIIDE